MTHSPDRDDEWPAVVVPTGSDELFIEVGESAFEAEPAFEEVVLRASDAEAEKAFAASLVELDRADREAGLLEDLDSAGPAPWDEAVVSDDELVASLGRSVHEADLMLLASIDPRDLSENLVRVDYLRALDRIAARVASMRHAAVVAMVGETSSEAYLPEVALEHEISVARRTSRYAAGKAIEVARALATTFPRVRHRAARRGDQRLALLDPGGEHPRRRRRDGPRGDRAPGPAQGAEVDRG
jgi:hypothetical protein